MEGINDVRFLTRLEQLQFSFWKSNNQQPPFQADANRNLYLHVSDAKGSSYDTSSVLCMEADKYAENYAGIVDNMDESESSKWQTSLSLDSILKLPEFQQANKSSKLFDNDNDDVILPLKTGKKAGDGSLGKSDALPESLPRNQPFNVNVTIEKKPYPHSAAFENSNTQWWKRHTDRSVCNTTGKGGTTPSNTVPRNVNTDSMYRPNKEETKESVHIGASKVGGPYANFGQKRKAQNNWKSGKEGSRPLKCEDGDDESERQAPFRTAKEQLVINQQKKFGNSNEKYQVTGSNYGSVKKSLGTRRGPANKFVPPVLGQDSDEGDNSISYSTIRGDKKSSGGKGQEMDDPVDERLNGIDPNMIELIKNEIMDHGTQITWADIAGLEFAKKTIKEIVVWPMLRPDIFTGLRGPPKGLLLFGPPGTGKTLIGKCIASQSKSTFFCISASTLTSKWVGEGEKMVRALFAVARCSQPAVVFIDEVDSLLSQRSDSEHESSRRIKTEFLVQLDGASTSSEERLLVIGATNRPQEIDEAARRRFVKRLLIPLPENIARKQIIVNLLSQQRYSLDESDLQHICDKTEGYSGADMSNLCREAALGPIRSIPFEEMESITPDHVRPILVEDFEEALLQVRASVSCKDLELYVDWNKTYGSFGH